LLCRAEIAAWQSQFMEMKSKALAESKKKPTIDWAYYEKTIMAQGLVAEYKKAVESIPELKFQTSVVNSLPLYRRCPDLFLPDGPS